MSAYGVSYTVSKLLLVRTRWKVSGDGGMSLLSCYTPSRKLRGFGFMLTVRATQVLCSRSDLLVNLVSLLL